MAKLAVIRIKGRVGISKGIIDTLEMLHLGKKHSCVVVEKNACNKGMINKVKDFVTFGEIDEDTLKLLVKKRGIEYKGKVKDSKGKIDYSSKYFEFNKKKYMPNFRLNPPTGGFGRKGIKRSFKQGGAMGNRGKKIIDLIKRMV